MVVFRLFEKKEENGKMVAVKISPKIESLYGLGSCGILQLLQGSHFYSHLDSFPIFIH